MTRFLEVLEPTPEQRRYLDECIRVYQGSIPLKILVQLMERRFGFFPFKGADYREALHTGAVLSAQKRNFFYYELTYLDEVTLSLVDYRDIARGFKRSW